MYPYGCGCNGYGEAPFTPYGQGCGGWPQVPPCQPPMQPQESVSSQLQNLELSLFGPFTATPVSGQPGRATWSNQCSANSAIPGFARNAGEGLICYILRFMAVVSPQIQFQYRFPVAYNESQFRAMPTVNAIPAGAIVTTIGITAPGVANTFQLQAGISEDNFPYYFSPNDNSNVHWTLIG